MGWGNLGQAVDKEGGSHREIQEMHQESEDAGPKRIRKGFG